MSFVGRRRGRRSDAGRKEQDVRSIRASVEEGGERRVQHPAFKAPKGDVYALVQFPVVSRVHSREQVAPTWKEGREGQGKVSSSVRSFLSLLPPFLRSFLPRVAVYMFSHFLQSLRWAL